MRDFLSKAWPHWRAAFVLFHVVAVCTLALPRHHGLKKRSSWDNSASQRWFASASAALNKIGIEQTPKELEDFLWDVGQGYMNTIKTLKKPFRPYAKHTGNNQGWEMFVAPGRRMKELHIEVLRNGQWEFVFKPLSPYRWMGNPLGHNRGRKTIGRSTYGAGKKRWPAFAKHLARHLKRDFPDASRARLRFWRIWAPTAAEERSGNLPQGHYEQEEVFDLTRPGDDVRVLVTSRGKDRKKKGKGSKSAGKSASKLTKGAAVSRKLEAIKPPPDKVVRPGLDPAVRRPPDKPAATKAEAD